MTAILNAKQTNPLLVKDIVGKTRPTVYDLPEFDHVYGKRVERDPDECAATVLHKWHIKPMPKSPASSTLDFIALNRVTTKYKIPNTQVREYRKSHPMNIKVGDNSPADVGETTEEWLKLRCRGTLPSDSDAYFTYGKPTRPSTPVAKLMTDLYQQEWISEHSKTSEKHKKKIKPQIYRQVKASTAPSRRITCVDKDTATLFKISKFKSTDSKITCWRPDDDPAILPILSQQEKIHSWTNHQIMDNEKNGVKKNLFSSNPKLEKKVTENKERSVKPPQKVETAVKKEVKHTKKESVPLDPTPPSSKVEKEPVVHHKEKVQFDLPTEGLEKKEKKEIIRFRMLEKPDSPGPVRGIREVEDELRVL